ncbi:MULTISPECIES: DUF1127 domain-containing protein [unclassified Rhizobium]|uniref:DUF1127 domain-containing protein n=1 Tax=unclassified Rhizobium TaxID=2613769 RepID=UPI0016222BD8|nr:MULTISPECIES: DUF1127 domain-containing protein [unclassified Rhizobium]MBB3319524.1 uncharacterized protein YjiS (DUF1127 family) [Rhizobium sp. BK181]MCS4095224.1 uncharacterized protein YjiS (DUF1127 family) [Rhizobium sp. BK176]
MITVLSAFRKVLRHYGRRIAVSKLRELDDDALKDIGLARSEIEAAAFGQVHAYSRGRRS